MKKIIAAAALAITATASHATTHFQEVYSAQGKTAAEIVQGFQVAAGTYEFKQTGNTLIGRVETQCGTGWTALDLVSDVIIEARNGRYRITFNDSALASFQEASYLPRIPGIPLDAHMAGASFLGVTNRTNSPTYDKCIVGINNFIARFHQDMMSHNSNW